jgi:hypothetical protein
MGLEDMRQPNAVLVQQIENAVDVSLRVDHEGHLAVVHKVTAVPETRRFERNDRDCVGK